MRTFLTIFMLILALPAAALADGRDVIRDCTDDERLSKRYSQEEYREALANIEADVDEYTDCRNVIRRAQLAALGGGSGGSGGSGGGDLSGALPGGAAGGGGAGAPPADPLATASPQERSAIDEIARSGGSPIALGGAQVDPTKAGEVPGVSAVGDLPTPLLILLALLAAGALAYGTTRVSKLVVARRAA